MTPRHVRRSDLGSVAAMLGRSFFDDPQMSFLFPDPTSRDEDLAVLFELCLTAAMKRGNTFLLPGEAGPVGATIWSPPDVEVISDQEGAAMGPLVGERYGGEGLDRMRAMGEAMAAHHPTDTHFYLWIVGVEPGQQGQGLGEAMLAPVLAQCDNDEMPAYLESSNPRNIGFYERLGFSVHSEFHPDGGPLFTGMWRSPR